MSGSLPTNQDLAEDAAIRKDRKWDFIQKVSYNGSQGLCTLGQNSLPHETREWKRNKKEDIQVPISWCDRKPRGLGLSWIGRVGVRKAAGRKWHNQWLKYEQPWLCSTDYKENQIHCVDDGLFADKLFI